MSKLTGLAAIVKGGGEMEPEQTEMEDPMAISVLPKPPTKGRLVTKKTEKQTGPKSSNPDFMQLKVYVRKTTKRAAARKWEDEGGGDVSDLIEQLLNQFLSS